MGFGAGSIVNDSKKIIINKHAKNSLKSKSECQLLFRIIKHLQPQNILELGSSFGVSTAYLCETNPETKITSLEGEIEIFNIAKNALDYKNLKIINADIDLWMNNKNSQNYECVIIDANHTYEATVRYFSASLKLLKKGGFMIIDDIYWSKEMTKAWKHITQIERVSVSIDLFSFGIIFIRPEQSKEHFMLRTFQLVH